MDEDERDDDGERVAAFLAHVMPGPGRPAMDDDIPTMKVAEQQAYSLLAALAVETLTGDATVVPSVARLYFAAAIAGRTGSLDLFLDAMRKMFAHMAALNGAPKSVASAFAASTQIVAYIEAIIEDTYAARDDAEAERAAAFHP
jgi:hypothetical protein